MVTVLRHTAHEEAYNRINPNHFEILSAFFQYFAYQFNLLFETSILNLGEALNKLRKGETGPIDGKHVETNSIQIQKFLVIEINSKLAMKLILTLVHKLKIILIINV